MTSLHNVWRGMMSRCYDETSLSYPRYGGAGVIVCSRWHSYASFKDDMSPRPVGTQLDRRDNSLGYEPGNCRWVTPTEQQRNRKNNLRITVGTETKTLAEWVERTGISAGTIQQRLKLGWPSEKILQPHRNPPPTHCKRGHELTPDNLRTSVRSVGGIARGCRQCDREYRQARKARSGTP